ncbi:DUF3817 domain-containing protein [uncultured Litoreibacter sp.]|uniref:DUF3817 domain-containing protein n=1 Tax=uncultured Litoreibacter sp. TaxID=1392394 RepID=UPI0026078C80|nr:DUF3817 domain-containing protein [uncultured Litoreibacter sp.]
MQTLRFFAVAEGVTLLVLLLIAMPLKYMAGLPEVVSVMGAVHGITFLVFMWIVIRSWAEGGLDGLGAVRLGVGAMIPFGGIFNERWLKNDKRKVTPRDL